jgi:hypothetical protein
VRGAVLAVVAAFAMTACATHPGSAAVVGSASISESRVDDVARALCSAQAGSPQQAQQPQELASRAARQGALNVLIQSELSRQFGDSQGLEPDPSQVSAALAANAASIQALPADRRSVLRDTLRDYAGGQLVLVEAGRRALAKRGGGAKVTQEQAVAEGTRLRDAWAKKVDVSVDPRYGEYKENALQSTSGSLSVPASQRAEDGDSPNPSAGWVAALPASQKCG